MFMYVKQNTRGTYCTESQIRRVNEYTYLDREMYLSLCFFGFFINKIQANLHNGPHFSAITHSSEVIRILISVFCSIFLYLYLLLFTFSPTAFLLQLTRTCRAFVLFEQTV